jgi:hypothetical protein
MPYIPFSIQGANDGPGVLGAGDDTKVLAYDHATRRFVMATGGGGGTPGGSDTQVQFNDGGAFGGDSALTWNKTTNILTVTIAKIPVVRAIGTEQPGMIRTDSILEWQNSDGSTLLWDISSGNLPRFFTGMSVLSGNFDLYSNMYLVNGGVLGRATNSTKFRFDTGEIEIWSSADAVIGQIDNTGNLAAGGNHAPTAVADLAASTTARASLRIRSGTAPTSPNDGDVWFDGTDLKIRIAGATKTVTVA